MRLRQGCRGWWIALIVAAADRISKAAVLRFWDRPRLLDRTFEALIPGVVNVKLATNRGMAFSMFSGQTLALSVLTIALLAFLMTWLLARPSAPRLLRTGLWLIVGGGLGNLYDRLAHGFVVDFIELAFVRFAVFNVADACICVGALLAVLGTLAKERSEEREKAHGGV